MEQSNHYPSLPIILRGGTVLKSVESNRNINEGVPIVWDTGIETLESCVVVAAS